MSTPAFSTPLRCVFFGSDAFAVSILKQLIERQDIVTVVAVVCRPGRQPVVDAIPDTAVLLQPERLDTAFFEQYKSLTPTIGIVASYGAIIPQRILDVPTIGTWNVHPSLLPAYRGPTPVETAIKDGVTHTGVSIMLLDAQMDHGPIFARSSYTIEPGAYAPSVREALAQLGGATLIATLEQYIREPFTPEPQHHEDATFTTKCTTENTELEPYTTPLPIMEAMIRAYPGHAWFVLPSGRRVVVFAASLHTNPTPGPRKFIATKRAISLVDGEQLLTFDAVQVAGGRPMDAQQFANGYRTQLEPPTRN